MLVLEEMENSIHPWIIRRVLDACREASKEKRIVLTTHSPILMNSVSPDEVWVIYRENGASHIRPLTELEPDMLTMWSGGQVSNFDYIDSGALLQAVPPGPLDVALTNGSSGQGE